MFYVKIYLLGVKRPEGGGKGMGQLSVKFVGEIKERKELEENVMRVNKIKML